MPQAPDHYCELIHTPAFEATVKGVLRAEQMRELEVTLAARPEAGAVIPETKGVRKLRVALTGRGKSGGARVIYYYHVPRERIYLFFLYPKNMQENLTPDQKRAVRRAVEVIHQEGC